MKSSDFGEDHYYCGQMFWLTWVKKVYGELPVAWVKQLLSDPVYNH